MPRFSHLVPILLACTLANPTISQAMPSPSADQNSVDESSAKRTRIAELPEHQREVIAFRELMALLQTAPSETDTLNLPANVKARILGLLTTEAEFEDSLRQDSQRQLQDLCSSAAVSDSLTLAYAIRGIDEQRDYQRRARFEGLLTGLSAGDLQSLKQLLRQYLASGEIVKTDLVALAETRPVFLKETFATFCSRTEIAAKTATPVEIVGPRDAELPSTQSK